MTSNQDKSRFGRLWLLFALVAVALVWSWSQVFEQSRPEQQTDGMPIELLRSEPGCDLAAGPCAAYAARFALVASARAAQDTIRWRVKLVGDAAPQSPQLAMSLLSPQGQPSPLKTVRVGDEWQAVSVGRVARDSVLRVSLGNGDLLRIAEFPLRGDG
jgi:hypothetical protein